MIGNCRWHMQRFCCDDISAIENYEEAISDTEHQWVCHHRLELQATGGIVNASKQDLIDWGIYWNRPANELIFLRRSEHNKLHQNTEEYKTKLSIALKGRVFSEEHKRKLSEFAKTRVGNKNSFYGKHHSDETKLKFMNRIPWNKGLKLKEASSDKCSDSLTNDSEAFKRG